MKAVIAALTERCDRLPPGSVLVVGLGWIGIVGLLDRLLPSQLSFTLVYLVGIAFVGWGGGRGQAVVAAAVATLVLAGAHWGAGLFPPSDLIAALDLVLRFLVFAAFGWLTAGLARLTRQLEDLIRQRTAQLQAEIDRHKRTAADLDQKRLLYRALFDLCPDGIILEDTGGTILDANQAICTISGYPLNELLSRNVRSLVPEEERATVDEHLARLGEGRTLEHEVRNVRRTGEACWMLLHEKLIELPDGKQAILVVGREITERKKAETELQEARDSLERRVQERTTDLEMANQALRDSEARLRLALTASNAGIWSHDLVTDVSTWDERSLELFGMEAHRNPSYQDWVACMHPEDRDLLEARTREVLKPGGSDLLNQEFRVLHPRNGLRWIAGLGRVERNAAGRAVRLAGINLDITERKQAEQELRRLNDTLEQRILQRTAALRESEERFRILSEASFEGVVLSKDYRILDCNEQMAAMLGFTREELLGRNLLDFSQEHARDSIRGGIASGRDVTVEDELLCKGGIRRTVEIRGRSPEGLGGLRLTTMRDVTDRKRAQALLEEQRNLAVRLSRTSDLGTALDCLLTTATNVESVDCGGVYLVHPATGELYLAAHRGLSPGFANQVSSYPADHTRTQLVLAGRPLYVLVEELDDPLSLLEEGLRALAIVPLLHEGSVIGALNLGSRGSKGILLQTRLTVETLAAQTAGAIARIRAETALKESEQRMRMVVAGAPIFIFAADETGTITFEAGNGLKGLGVETGTVVGRKVEELYARYPVVIENMRRALNGEEFSTMVDLGAVAVDCWYIPTRDAAGRVVGYSGVATNVTERVRLEQQILEVTDREQARMGQDLHDGLCQQLVSLAFDACDLDRQLSQKALPECALSKRIADLLDQAITEARQLSRGLFPIRLEAEGLDSALEELARTTSGRFQVQCTFRNRTSFLTTGHSMATHLYRITQEAVVNAVKHGHPRSIVIALEYEAGCVQLRIQDDGAGFAPGQTGGSLGMGLPIMDYRARAIGGRLKIERGTSGGTIVRCEVPRPDGAGQ